MCPLNLGKRFKMKLWLHTHRLASMQPTTAGPFFWIHHFTTSEKLIRNLTCIDFAMRYQENFALRAGTKIAEITIRQCGGDQDARERWWPLLRGEHVLQPSILKHVVDAPGDLRGRSASHANREEAAKATVEALLAPSGRSLADPKIWPCRASGNTSRASCLCFF